MDNTALPEFKRSVENGYIQSHPLSFMYTASAYAIDQQELNDNYMRIIFGGAPPEKDLGNTIYNHTIRDVSENPVTATIDRPTEWDLSQPDPGKEAMLQAFYDQRNFVKSRMTSDVERALKSRNTHNNVHVTFNGKRLGNRFHGIAGQAAEAVYPPNVVEAPKQLLSSKTFAPQPNGSRAPLYVEELDVDQRVVPSRATRDEETRDSFVNPKVSNLYTGYLSDQIVDDYIRQLPKMDVLFGHDIPRTE